jgi:flagellar protein FliO/FliZ
MILRSVIRTARLCRNTALAWLLWAGAAWAAGQPLGDLQYQGPEQQVAPFNIGGALLQLVLSLVVVIGLAIILVKFLQKSNALSRHSAWARVVDQVYVGPNKMLVLAEIFGKVYVLGVTDHGITTLLGENDIDLSQVKQAFLDAENRKKIIPAYINNPFLNILDSKIGELKKRYENRGKGGSPR